jgi:hypothetical protein
MKVLLLSMVIAFGLGWHACKMHLGKPSPDIVALRQVALDLDEQVHQLNQELSDQKIATDSAITYLEEEKIRLLALLPNVAAPCYFPERD